MHNRQLARNMQKNHDARRLAMRMRSSLGAALAVAAFGVVSPAWAIPIQVAFNFVPNGTLTANTGDVTNAATITSGAPDTVTQILLNNVGLTSGQTVTLTPTTPVTL